MSLFGLLLAILCLHSAGASQELAPGTKSRPRFEDFPAGEVFQGKPPKIVWPRGFDPSEPPNDRVVFAVQSAVQKKPNFAGHYGIAEYSCGTNCSELVSVDLKSGAVLDNYPYTTIESHFDSKEGATYEGITFRQRSRLLIASGCFDWDVLKVRANAGQNILNLRMANPFF